MNECQYLPFHSDISHWFGTLQKMSAPLILTYPADFGHVRKNEILGIVIIISMYDEEKQSKVVSKNGSHGTIWKQCCLSPLRVWNPRSNSVSLVNSSEMNVGLRPAAPPPGGQAFGLHSSPRNSPLTHYYSLDFWLWRAQGLWQHCFHIVPRLPFLLTTSSSFSLSFPD